MIDRLVKIYYADDDADDRFLFETALQQVQVNFQLFDFANGAALEQALEDSQYDCDLIFLDLNMPVRNGLETLANLQEAIKRQRLKVVVFTTSGDSRVLQQTHQLNAVLFLQKPNSFPELIASLREIIANRDHFKLPVEYNQFKFEPQHG